MPDPETNYSNEREQLGSNEEQMARYFPQTYKTLKEIQELMRDLGRQEDESARDR